MSNDPFSIVGKRAVIVGGTAGIGYAVATHFVASGSDVVIAGRRADGPELAAAIGAQFVWIDVLDDVSVSGGMSEAAEILGGIDVLIFNVGTAGDPGPIASLDVVEYQRIMDVNFFGALRTLKAGLPHFRDGAVYIATSSPGGRQAIAGGRMSAYSSSKAALDIFIQSAALDLAPAGYRVCGVLPGLIRTEIGGFPADGSEPWLAALTASGRSRDPEVMAAVYHFLASDAGEMMQGAILAADDGVTAGIPSGMLARLFA